MEKNTTQIMTIMQRLRLHKVGSVKNIVKTEKILGI